MCSCILVGGFEFWSEAQRCGPDSLSPEEIETRCASLADALRAGTPYDSVYHLAQGLYLPRLRNLFLSLGLSGHRVDVCQQGRVKWMRAQVRVSWFSQFRVFGVGV